MEGQVTVGGNNNDGGQVRRVHIVYYLSRNGRIEHLHLIRIHHVSRNGIHLRDVKSWLSELRGMDMPDSFAWSYKRIYKGSYVWQDLLDEDLITPICDNEYVLKGSEISSKTYNNGVSAYCEKEVLELEKSSHFEVDLEDPKYHSAELEYALDFSTNTSIEIEESSFRSNVTNRVADTPARRYEFWDSYSHGMQQYADTSRFAFTYDAFAIAYFLRFLYTLLCHDMLNATLGLQPLPSMHMLFAKGGLTEFPQCNQMSADAQCCWILGLASFGMRQLMMLVCWNVTLMCLVNWEPSAYGVRKRLRADMPVGTSSLTMPLGAFIISSYK